MFKHWGTKPVKARVEVQVQTLTQPRNGSALTIYENFNVAFERGDKIIYTADKKSKSTMKGQVAVEFNETLVMDITLYVDSKGKYQDKPATLIVRQRRKGAAGLKNDKNAFKTVGSVPFNLADFGDEGEPSGLTSDLSLCVDEGVELVATIKCTKGDTSPLKKEDSPAKKISSDKGKTNDKSKKTTKDDDDDDDEEDDDDDDDDDNGKSKSANKKRGEDTNKKTPAKKADSIKKSSSTPAKSAPVQAAAVDDDSKWDFLDEAEGGKTITAAAATVTAVSKTKSSAVREGDDDDDDSADNKNSFRNALSQNLNDSSLGEVSGQLREASKKIAALEKKLQAAAERAEDQEVGGARADYLEGEVARLKELVDMQKADNGRLRARSAALEGTVRKLLMNVARLEVALCSEQD